MQSVKGDADADADAPLWGLELLRAVHDVKTALADH